MIRAIVIEDDKTIRLEMLKMLSTFSFVSVIFDTGDYREAENYLINNIVDLVISDIELPTDKNTIFHILNRLLDNNVSLPHVILFSGSEIDYSNEAINSQAIIVACLTKPVKLNYLSIALNKAKYVLDKFPEPINKRHLTIDDYVFVRYRGGGVREPGQWFLRIGDIKFIVADGANVNIVFSKKIQKSEIVTLASGLPQKAGDYFLTDDETARYFSGIKALQERLDSKYFVRVNPGNIINVQFVEKVDIHDGQIQIQLFGGYKFELRGDAQILDFNSFFKL